MENEELLKIRIIELEGQLRNCQLLLNQKGNNDSFNSLNIEKDTKNGQLKRGHKQLLKQKPHEYFALNEEYLALNEELKANNEELEQKNTQLQALNLKLNKRIKEIRFLIHASELMNNPGLSQEKLFEQLSIELPFAFQFPQKTAAQITYIDKNYASAHWVKHDISIASHFEVNGQYKGSIKIGCFDKSIKTKDAFFLKEEQELINALSNFLGNYLDREMARIEAKENAEKFHTLYNHSPDMYVSVSPEKGLIKECNATLLKQTGYTKNELIDQPVFMLYDEECHEQVHKAFEEFVETGMVKDKELVLKMKTGEKMNVSLNVKAIYDNHGKIKYSMSSWRDITERKRIQKLAKEKSDEYQMLYEEYLAINEELEVNNAELERKNNEIEKINTQLVGSEEKYRTLFESMNEGFAFHESLYDEEGTPVDYIFLDVNNMFEEFTGLKKQLIVNKKVTEVIPDIGKSKPNLIQLYGNVAKTGKDECIEIYFSPFKKWYKISVFSPRKNYFCTIFEDTTTRKVFEQQLVETKQYAEAILNSLPGIFYQISKQRRFTKWNKNFEIVTEYSAREIERLAPTDLFESGNKDFITDILIQVYEEERTSFESLLCSKNGKKTPYFFTGELINFNNDSYIIGMGIDASEVKKAEADVKKVMAELERSNKELEQFAYVASHDLQEPLRMVSSFTQLLEKRYKDKLDQDAHEFIHFAVDGANRMQRLINDLLQYSRVTTKGKEFEPTDICQLLGHVRVNLQVMIDESNALITNDELPTLKADENQMYLLFQNLIQNAIKFKGTDPPNIHISAQQVEKSWLFSIKDNGIGIDEKYKDRIFIIFQRLHTKEDYPGTGIGLAVCKRIIERHQGSIWFESEPGHGTTFYFKIPNNL